MHEHIYRLTMNITERNLGYSQENCQIYVLIQKPLQKYVNFLFKHNMFKETHQRCVMAKSHLDRTCAQCGKIPGIRC